MSQSRDEASGAMPRLTSKYNMDLNNLFIIFSLNRRHKNKQNIKHYIKDRSINPIWIPIH